MSWPSRLRGSLLPGFAGLACALAAAAGAGGAEAATVQLNWTEQSTSGPAPRTMATLALAPSTMDVLFGGSIDGSSNGVADTWQFDGTSWSEAHPVSSPPGRVGAAMAFDSALGRTILFGGYAGGVATNDTWAWDGSEWQQVATTDAPSPRALAAMTYDPARGELVLFGGSALTGGSAASGLLGDTWAFDGDWHLLSEGGPSPRSWSALAGDDPTSRLVLFGGYDGTVLGDTWTWDGTSWAQQAPPHTPGPRYQHALVYDANMSSVVLLSGVDQNSRVVGASWRFSNGDWEEVESANAPSARTLAAATYDSFRREEVVFGGTDGTQTGAHLLGDTWTAQVGVPAMSLNPTSIDFGKVNELDAAYQTLTVTNSGTGILSIAQLQLGGADPQPFSISADGCTGAALGAGASCQVGLRYQYSTSQSCADPCSAQLAVIDATGSGQLVPLTAVQTFAVLTRSQASLDFGNVMLGNTSTVSDTISNTGTGDLLISRIYSQSPDYTVASDCPIAPLPVAPGAACTVRVTFTPSGLGQEGSQVILLDNEPPGYDFIAVGGYGVPGSVVLQPSPVSGVYGGSADVAVTATGLDGMAFAGLAVTASLPNGAAAQATTDATGSAVFRGLSLAGLHAGTYPQAVTVAFAGDASHLATTAAADLSIASAPVSLAVPAVTPLAPNAVVQFSDSVAVATAVTSSAGTPDGRVVLTVNGHALPSISVDTSSGKASASARLDQALVAGAGTYGVSASFIPASTDFSSAAASGTFTVAPEDVSLRYTGGFLVDSGAVPTLSVIVAQPAGDSEFVDFGQVPVWARFDVVGGGTQQTLFAQVADTSDWSTTGRGSAESVPSALPAGAYTVAIHLVSASGVPVAAGSGYVAGDGIRVGVTASPTAGSYTSGAGTVADPAANAGDPAGHFAFVGSERSGQPQGSAAYSYRASMLEGGSQHDVDVWMTSTSVTAFGPAGKGAAQVAGACTITYIDSLTGVTYGAPAACSYAITDSEATGSAPASFAITVTAPDGTVIHSVSGTPGSGAVRVHL